MYKLENEITRRETKSVYKDEDSIIKLFIENYSVANILNEALNQARVFEGTDLNIPKLKEVTKIAGRWAIVQEYVEGESLDNLMNENPEKIDEYMDMFVNIHLEVLSKHVPMLNRIKEKYRRKLNDEESIDSNTRFELLQRLEGMHTKGNLCHGDFNPSNIIIKKDGSHCILDWAHATQGNGAADAALTYLLFKMDDRDDVAEKYINLFCEKSGVDRREIQRWIPIVAATQLKTNKNKQDILRSWIDIADYE